MVRKGGFMYSSCGDKHNYEPTKVFVVPGRREPSRERFLRFAANHCPGRDRYATWRLGADRAYGDRTLTCYRRDQN
jgi:hypothetical protein